MIASVWTICLLLAAHGDGLLHNADGSITMRVGMSCGFTGLHWRACLDIKRGLSLLSYALGESNFFQSVDRNGNARAVRLSVEIKDDKDGRRVKDCYTQFAKDQFDAVMGPYSSRSSYEASQIANDHRLVMMLHNRGVAELYASQTERSYLFSMGVDESDYFRDSLERLKKHNANTILFRLMDDGGSDSFSMSVCLGAIQIALKEGFDVLGFSNATDVFSFLREASAKRPDVIVACGLYEDMINFVLSARALYTEPKAILMLQVASQMFVDAVGAPNANYILTAVTWHAQISIGTACPLFGTAKTFSTMYNDMYGKEPTPSVARAAAGALALVAAGAVAHSQSTVSPPANSHASAKQQKKKTLPKPDMLDQYQLYQALHDLDLDTFYGRLQFDSWGRLRDAKTYTVQFQPYRYSSSHITPIGLHVGGNLSSELLYPMPAWLRKQLEVFPCPVGTEIDASVVDSTRCTLCPKGTRRNSELTFCLVCGANTYAPKVGSSFCERCPEGATCDGGFYHEDGLPPSSPGYYKLLGPPPLYIRCQPASLCLGNNNCSAPNRGILCEQCEHGYINRQGTFLHSTECFACPRPHSILGAIIATCAFYYLLVKFLEYLDGLAATSTCSIGSTVMKILLNYLIFVSAVLDAIRPANGALAFFVGLLQDPIGSTFFLKCYIDPPLDDDSLVGSPSIQWRLALGIFLLPIVILIEYFIFNVDLLCKVRQFLTDHGDSETLAWSSADPANAYKNVEVTCLSEDPYWARPQISRYWNLQSYVTLFIRRSIVWLFVLYPITIRMAIEGLLCVETDISRLQAAPEVECMGSAHMSWMMISILGLLIHGIIVPLLLFKAIHKRRDTLWQTQHRMITSFFCTGFVSHLYFFEFVFMLRKLAFYLCFLSTSRYARVIFMFLLQLVFLTLHIKYRPYDSRDSFILDKLETTSLLSLIGITFSILLFNVDEDGTTDFHEIMYVLRLKIGAVLFAASTALIFFIRVVWNCYRHAVVKPVVFRCEILPEATTMLDWITMSPEHHLNRIVFDCKTHMLNISSLNHSEREYLLKTLSHVMGWYVHSHGDRPFHSAFIITAVREAMSYCIKKRRARASRMVQVIKDKQNLRQHTFEKMLRNLHESLGISLEAGRNDDDGERLTFMFEPGALGVGCDDRGFVQEVFDSGQAHAKGIRKGEFLIERVGPELYSSDTLLRAEMEGSAYEVTFQHIIQPKRSVIREVLRLFYLDGHVSRQVRSKVIKAVSSNSATVDELLDALMACERDITDHNPLYYQKEFPVHRVPPTVKGQSPCDYDPTVSRSVDASSTADKSTSIRTIDMFGHRLVSDGSVAKQGTEAESLSELVAEVREQVRETIDQIDTSEKNLLGLGLVKERDLLLREIAEVRAQLAQKGNQGFEHMDREGKETTALESNLVSITQGSSNLPQDRALQAAAGLGEYEAAVNEHGDIDGGGQDFSSNSYSISKGGFSLFHLDQNQAMSGREHNDSVGLSLHTSRINVVKKRGLNWADMEQSSPQKAAEQIQNHFIEATCSIVESTSASYSETGRHGSTEYNDSPSIEREEPSCNQTAMSSLSRQFDYASILSAPVQAQSWLQSKVASAHEHRSATDVGPQIIGRGRPWTKSTPHGASTIRQSLSPHLSETLVDSVHNHPRVEKAARVAGLTDKHYLLTSLASTIEGGYIPHPCANDEKVAR